MSVCKRGARFVEITNNNDKGYLNMSILATILNTLVVLLAILLIALILVQPSKSGGGFGSAFGGLGESVFGAQAMSHLSKLTVWCITIFFILTLASAIVAGHLHTSDSSVIEGETSIALGGSAPGETPKTAADETVAAVQAASEAFSAQEEAPAEPEQ